MLLLLLLLLLWLLATLEKTVNWHEQPMWLSVR